MANVLHPALLHCSRRKTVICCVVASFLSLTLLESAGPRPSWFGKSTLLYVYRSYTRVVVVSGGIGVMDYRFPAGKAILWLIFVYKASC